MEAVDPKFECHGQNAKFDDIVKEVLNDDPDEIESQDLGSDYTLCNNAGIRRQVQEEDKDDVIRATAKTMAVQYLDMKKLVKRNIKLERENKALKEEKVSFAQKMNDDAAIEKKFNADIQTKDAQIKKLEEELKKATALSEDLLIIAEEREKEMEQKLKENAEALEKQMEQKLKEKAEAMETCLAEFVKKKEDEKKILESELKQLKENFTVLDSHFTTKRNQIKLLLGMVAKYEKEVKPRVSDLENELKKVTKEREDAIAKMLLEMQKSKEEAKEAAKSLAEKCKELEIAMEKIDGKKAKAKNQPLDEDLSETLSALFGEQKYSHQKDKDLEKLEEEIARLQGELLKTNVEMAEKERKLAINEHDLAIMRNRLDELSDYERPATIIMDFFPIVLIQKRTAADFFAGFYDWIRPKIGVAANDILAITASKTPMKECVARRSDLKGQLYIYFANLRSAIKFQCATDGEVLWIHVDGKKNAETIKPRSRFSRKYTKMPDPTAEIYSNSLVCIPDAAFPWER